MVALPCFILTRPAKKVTIENWTDTDVVIVLLFLDEGLRISFDRTQPGSAVTHLHTRDDEKICREVF